MKHILLVDDDSSMLNLFSRALSDYTVTIAHDGFEALAASKQLGQLDLLITDYFMPSMIGDELIARVREQRPDLPHPIAGRPAASGGERLERDSRRCVRRRRPSRSNS